LLRNAGRLKISKDHTMLKEMKKIERHQNNAARSSQENRHDRSPHHRSQTPIKGGIGSGQRLLLVSLWAFKKPTVL
jgi:hypothetical protein